MPSQEMASSTLENIPNHTTINHDYSQGQSYQSKISCKKPLKNIKLNNTQIKPLAPIMITDLPINQVIIPEIKIPKL
jgi:hypothetical protein